MKVIMGDEVKFQRCPNGHVLGEVRRNGSGHGRLRVYRHARPGGDEEVYGMEYGMVTGEGYIEVRCSVCGAVRRWYPEAKEEVKV